MSKFLAVILGLFVLAGCCTSRKSVSGAMLSGSDEVTMFMPVNSWDGMASDEIDSSDTYWGLFGVVITNLHLEGHFDEVLKAVHDAWQRASPSVQVPALIYSGNPVGEVPSLKMNLERVTAKKVMDFIADVSGTAYRVEPDAIHFSSSFYYGGGVQAAAFPMTKRCAAQLGLSLNPTNDFQSAKAALMKFHISFPPRTEAWLSRSRGSLIMLHLPDALDKVRYLVRLAEDGLITTNNPAAAPASPARPERSRGEDGK